MSKAPSKPKGKPAPKTGKPIVARKKAAPIKRAEIEPPAPGAEPWAPPMPKGHRRVTLSPSEHDLIVTMIHAMWSLRTGWPRIRAGVEYQRARDAISEGWTTRIELLWQLIHDPHKKPVFAFEIDSAELAFVRNCLGILHTILLLPVVVAEVPDPSRVAAEQIEASTARFAAALRDDLLHRFLGDGT